MNQKIDKTSRIALVIGAGSGIGKAVAQGLLDDGWVVVLVGRRMEPLDELVQAALERGQTALAVPTDVRQAASVAAPTSTQGVEHIAGIWRWHIPCVHSDCGTDDSSLPGASLGSSAVLWPAEPR